MNAAMVMDDTVINAQTTMAAGGGAPFHAVQPHGTQHNGCACTSVIRLRPIILPANTVPGVTGALCRRYRVRLSRSPSRLRLPSDPNTKET